MLRGKKLLMQLTGSIACYKACELISLLQKAGVEIRVVCSKNALQFIGPATLEGLTGHKVYTDTFETGDMMSHISLTRWCDFSLIYPASANSIAKIAQGVSDNLVSSLHLAMPEDTPQFIAPAMNTKMLENTSTQNNLTTLSRKGIIVLPTDSGVLACKEVGDGKLISPEDTLFKLLEFFDVAAKNILVTGGGTSEPIDGVRAITNFSTGNTSVEIANSLTLRGHKVTLCLPKENHLKAFCSKLLAFTDHQSLQQLLSTQLSTKHYDYVIHAAAVSDYSVESIISGNSEYKANTNIKIPSKDELTIKLKKNDKLINSIKEFSLNPGVKVIGFKLTKNATLNESMQKINDIFKRGLVDYIVHNDLMHINGDHHRFDIYNEKLLKVKSGENKQAIAYSINQLIKEDSRTPEPLQDMTL